MNLVLYGIKYSGKSTVGKLLAERLNRPFLDNDRLIEQEYHDRTGLLATCREIHLKEGAKYFREAETRQLLLLKDQKECIIAIGGGTPIYFDNRKILPSLGTLVYLQAPLETLWKRVVNSEIPAYLDPGNPEQDFYRMARQYALEYEAMASWTIPTEGISPQEVAEIILKRCYEQQFIR